MGKKELIADNYIDNVHLGKVLKLDSLSYNIIASNFQRAKIIIVIFVVESPDEAITLTTFTCGDMQPRKCVSQTN